MTNGGARTAAWLRALAIVLAIGGCGSPGPTPEPERAPHARGGAGKGSGSGFAKTRAPVIEPPTLSIVAEVEVHIPEGTPLMRLLRERADSALQPVPGFDPKSYEPLPRPPHVAVPVGQIRLETLRAATKRLSWPVTLVMGNLDRPLASLDRGDRLRDVWLWEGRRPQARSKAADNPYGYWTARWRGAEIVATTRTDRFRVQLAPAGTDLPHRLSGMEVALNEDLDRARDYAGCRALLRLSIPGSPPVRATLRGVARSRPGSGPSFRENAEFLGRIGR